jgi:MoaA/NifB/PqqE/SkfB family radical SAM enzyme
MLSFVKFIFRRMLLDSDKLRFALPRMFPPSDPKLSAIRMKNFISTYLAWKYGLKLKTKPIILQIEPVRGCNLNCVMCRAGEFKFQKLLFDDFKRIIDNLPEVMFITLNYGGEPFLSKDTIKMIRYAQKKAIIIIFSNFTVLPEPEDIINSGLFEINASIDSFDKEKYNFIRRKNGNINQITDKTILDIKDIVEIIRKGKVDEEFYQKSVRNQIIKNNNEYENGKKDTLEIVIKNLKNLVDTRRKLRKKLPIISISSIFAKETKEDVENIIRNAIELGVDRVKFQRLAFDVPGILHVPDTNDFRHIFELKERYKDQIKILIVNSEFGGHYPRGYCYLAHFMILIDINKKIFPCCMPYQHMDTDEAFFGTATSKEDMEIAMEKRQKFIWEIRKLPPNFCIKCPLYFRE